MSLVSLKTKLSEIAVHAPVPAADPGAPVAAAVPLVVEAQHAAKGVDLDVRVPVERVLDAALLMDEAAFMLESLTGVDWISEQQFEVVYDYTSVVSGERVTIRARTSRAMPQVPSIASVYPGANWHEREAHDFFGLIFSGHPGLATLLLPEDAAFHPLLKDFSA